MPTGDMVKLKPAPSSRHRLALTSAANSTEVPNSTFRQRSVSASSPRRRPHLLFRVTDTSGGRLSTSSWMEEVISSYLRQY